MKNKRSNDTKKGKIASFDPNGPALEHANIFGLPFSSDESDIVLIPVPWEATVSYGGGTAKGPGHILEASAQVDLFHPEFPYLWKTGIAMEPESEALYRLSKKCKKNATKVIDELSRGNTLKKGSEIHKLLEQVNEGSLKMIEYVYENTASWMKKGKLVGLVGGDHSTPLGFFRALAEKYPSFGVLQIDAHMDLRKAFEGFTYSHASIMYNALQLKQISKLVQVGIRDFCEEEHDYALKYPKKIKVFTYDNLKRAQFSGVSWKRQCDEIIKALPAFVHISFDIDGLDPKLCPGTGTPVPGGFEYHEVTYLLSALASSGKKIISFDLNEVSPDESDWNGNVGARMLFHLCGILARSNGRI